MKNYEFTGETMQYEGHTLHRIRALRDIQTNPMYGNSYVEQGELGGWIESENNLSQVGRAWVASDAKVYAIVRGSAKVFGDSRISGNAHLDGNAIAMGDCSIAGQAKILDSARVSGKAVVDGNAVVRDSSCVSGKVKVGGTTEVRGDSVLMGELKITQGIFLNQRIENDRGLRVMKVPSKINGVRLTLEQKEAMFVGRAIQIPSKSNPNKKISVKLDDHNKVVLVTGKKMSQSFHKRNHPHL